MALKHSAGHYGGGVLHDPARYSNGGRKKTGRGKRPAGKRMVDVFFSRPLVMPGQQPGSHPAGEALNFVGGPLDHNPQKPFAARCVLQLA